MPDIRSDKQTATTYPPRSLYEDWVAHADSLDMPVSQFIIRMTETGRKEISMKDIATESLRGLRQQQRDLQQELEHQRDRNRRLERQLQHTAHAEIIDFVEDNPGVSSPEIIQHIADTIPGRVTSLLDILEGDVLKRQDNDYHLVERDATDKENTGGDS